MEALLSQFKKEREEAYLSLLRLRVGMEDCGYCDAYKQDAKINASYKHHHDCHVREIRRATELVKGYDIVIKALTDSIDMLETAHG